MDMSYYKVPVFNRDGTIAYKDPLFLDIETTGLSAGKHEIISVALLELTDKSPSVFHFPAQRLADAHPRALEVNGYDHEEWTRRWKSEGSLSWPVFMKKLQGIWKDKVIVGCNQDFDLRRLENRLWVELMEDPTRYYKSACVGQMYLGRFGVLSSLQGICDHYGISNVGAHEAGADVLRTREAYIKLRDELRGNPRAQGI